MTLQSALTQTQELEAIYRKHAIHIICQFSWRMLYSNMLVASNLTLLSHHLIAETTYLARFSQHYQSCILTNIRYPVCTISSLRHDLIQLHPGSDHMNITQNPPPTQTLTVHSCNMAFPTTSIGFCIGIIIILSHELLATTCFIVFIHCDCITVYCCCLLQTTLSCQVIVLFSYSAILLQAF